MSSQTNAIERTLFLGPRIPNHVKELAKLLQSIKKPVFRQILKLAVQDFEGKEITSDAYLSLRKAVNVDCNFDLIYGSLHYLLKRALCLNSSSMKQEIFKEDLRILKIPDDFIEDFVNVVFGPRRTTITNNFEKNTPALPKLSRMRWRIDVAISTSVLSRVLEPVIIIELKLSNSQSYVFEARPSQFHRLRFAIANLLKEMEHLETRNVLKY